jgi:succinate dehydrogenase/fumarate reductase flavoprotein subunit
LQQVTKTKRLDDMRQTNHPDSNSIKKGEALMSSAEKKQKGLTRRDFVKGAATGAVGGLLAGTAGAALAAPKEKQKPWLPAKWDYEADVVIVGYGGAGAVAAITAHDAGAKVLILEKAPEGQEGGNTRCSMNITFSPTPVDKAIIYMTEFCGPYTVPQDIIQAWAEEMEKNWDWIKSLGGKPMVFGEVGVKGAEWPELPGAECQRYFTNGPGAGRQQLWKLLKASVDQRKIQVLYAAPAKELIQDCSTREILGVKAESKGTEITIKAKRATILTCGGFENNRQMTQDYIQNFAYAYPKGTPYNTGDGIKMGLAVGADLWHMQNCAGPAYVFKRPDVDYIEYASWPTNNYIYVGADGTRFVCESGGFHAGRHGKMLEHGQWHQSPTPSSSVGTKYQPMYIIFDENFRKAGPICNTEYFMGWNAQVARTYHWSKDNISEIAKGWIVKADTIRELGEKINVGAVNGLDPAILEQTVKTYNGYCAAGKDPDFLRGADPGAEYQKSIASGVNSALLPIETPPFYAMPLVAGYTNTQGGPRRNAKAQIVQPNGNPIPRLYSAGELGSVYSMHYQGGGNVGECQAFGRIAGRNAAAQKPWK